MKKIISAFIVCCLMISLYAITCLADVNIVSTDALKISEISKENGKLSFTLTYTQPADGSLNNMGFLFFNLNWDEGQTIPATGINVVLNNEAVKYGDISYSGDIAGDSTARGDITIYGPEEEPLPSFSAVISVDLQDSYDSLYLCNTIPGTVISDPANTAAIMCDWSAEELVKLNNPIVISSSLPDEPEQKVKYQAYLESATTSVTRGGTFTADVYMQSDADLASGELNLTAENGSITKIDLADGIGNSESSFTDGTGIISFYNNTASAKEGLKVATVTVKADDAVDDVVLKITDGAASVSGEPNDIDVDVSGENAQVKVEILKDDLVSCDVYAGGKYIVLYTGDDVAEGSIAKYKDTAMAYSEKYNDGEGAWFAIVDEADVSGGVVNKDVTTEAGDKNTVVYDGDVNGNGKPNIVDAQIAYDISNNVYEDFTKATLSMWQKADVNTDAQVTAADAHAIQYYIHYGTFEVSGN